MPMKLLTIAAIFPVFLVCSACRQGGQEAADRPTNNGTNEISVESKKQLEEAADNSPDPVTAASLPTAVRDRAEYEIGQSEQLAFVRLYADSFRSLTKRERVLAYHLVRAVLGGRDIALDQHHRNVVELRNLLICLLENSTEPDPNLDAALAKYLQSLQVNEGFYDSLTGKKYTPDFSVEELGRVAEAAYGMGAELELAKDESLTAKLARLRKIAFDAEYEKDLANSSPLAGHDMIGDSNLNLYKDVTMRDLNRYTERYPENSRLVKIEGQLEEEVYRAGDTRRKIMPGRYSQELRRVMGWLYDAMPVAQKRERRTLTELVEYLQSGEKSAFYRAFAGSNGESYPVEFSLGFTDTSLDPRGVKGLYEGFVGVLDQANTSRVQSLIRHAQYFESKMPWGENERRTWGELPRVSAIELLASARVVKEGGRVAFRFYGEEDRNQLTARKILVFTNVVESSRQSIVARMAKEFIAPADRKGIVASLDELNFFHVAAREVMGRELGRKDGRKLNKLMSHRAWLEELKALLVAVYLTVDPKIAELGLLTGQDAGVAAQLLLGTESLLWATLHDEKGLRQPFFLAHRMLARYLVDVAKVLDLAQQEDKTYPVIADSAAFQEAVGKLLRRCQRILVSGDRRSALRLLAKLGGPPKWVFLPKWRDRAAQANIRKQLVYVMPKLKPSFDSQEKVKEVSLSNDESFDQQMRRYQKY